MFPHGLTKCSEDADMLQYAHLLDDGYSQSKWVAEQLVLRARKRGLPMVIYRLGMTSFNSSREMILSLLFQTEIILPWGVMAPV